MFLELWNQTDLGFISSSATSHLFTQQMCVMMFIKIGYEK